MARTIVSQSIHDAEVRRRYGALLSDGRWSRVAADLPGFTQPALTNGYIPDIAGIYDGRLWLIEVETSETYAIEHSLSQYRAFARAGSLIVVVPTACAADLRVVLARNGIASGGIWTY